MEEQEPIQQQPKLFARNQISPTETLQLLWTSLIIYLFTCVILTPQSILYIILLFANVISLDANYIILSSSDPNTLPANPV